MGIFEILSLILSVFGSGMAIYAQDQANQQNIANANAMMDKQQDYAQQNAATANQATQNLYYSLYSPGAQVKQLKDAGLSPGLFYSHGGVGTVGTSAAQATAPISQVPTINPIVDNAIMNRIVEATKTASDTRKNETERKAKETEIGEIESKIKVNNATIDEITSITNLNNVRTQNEAIDGQIKQMDLEYTRATQSDRIKLVSQTLENLQKENEKILEEINGAKIDNANKQKLYDAQLQKLKAETAKIWKEKMLVEAETAVAKQKEILTNEQAKMTYAERQKTWTEISKIEAEITQCNANSAKLLSDVDLNNTKQISEIIGQFTSVVNAAVSLGKPNKK